MFFCREKDAEKCEDTTGDKTSGGGNNKDSTAAPDQQMLSDREKRVL